MGEEYPLEVRKRFAINVQANQEVIHLVTEIANLELATKDIHVSCDEEDRIANALALQVKDVADGVEILEKGFTQPLHIYKTMIHDSFRGMKDRCKKMQDGIGNVVLDWRNKRDKQMEAEFFERQKDRMEAATLSGNSAEVQVLQDSKPPKAESVTRTSLGKTYEREFSKVIIDDKAAIIKAVMSKAKSCNKITFDLLDVNTSKLEDLMVKQKVKVPGAHVEVEKKLIASK